MSDGRTDGEDHQSPSKPPGPTPWRDPESRDPNFYYDKREREALKTGERESPRGGFFRRSRSLTITLIDLIIVLFLFAIFWFVLRPMASREQIEDYRFEVKAVHEDGEIRVAVTVTDLDPEEEPDAGSNLVRIRSGSAEQSDLLPTVDAVRVIRLQGEISRFEPAITDAGLRVTVEALGEVREVRVPVEGPPLAEPGDGS